VLISVNKLDVAAVWWLLQVPLLVISCSFRAAAPGRQGWLVQGHLEDNWDTKCNFSSCCCQRTHAF
jgi:cytochrome bd-type quinol oxidase subunit 1